MSPFIKMQLRTRDTKLIQVSRKPAARLTQDKHKSVPLFKAEAAEQLPALVAQIKPRPGSMGCAVLGSAFLLHPLPQTPWKYTLVRSTQVTAGRGQASLLCYGQHNLFSIYMRQHGSVQQHCPVAKPHYDHILWSWQTAHPVTPKAVVIKW